MSGALAIGSDLDRLFSAAGDVGQSSAHLQMKEEGRSYLAHFLRPISAKPGYFFDLEVADLFDECNEEGWDGYDAKPLDQHSVEIARRFFTSMPRWAWAPEIVPHADGSLILQWGNGKSSLLTLAFKADGRIVYAGRFLNGTSAYGTEIFENEIPDTLMEYISRTIQ